MCHAELWHVHSRDVFCFPVLYNTAPQHTCLHGINGNNSTISSPPSHHRCRRHPLTSLSLPHHQSCSFMAVTTTTSLPTPPTPLQQPSILLRRQTATTERMALSARHPLPPLAIVVVVIPPPPSLSHIVAALRQ
jgi:hypothetical protein